MDLARDSTEHLLLLINDLLDSSQINSGKLRLNCDLLNLLEVVQSVINLLSFQAKKKGVVISLKNTIVRAIYIKSDEMRLKQILTNLIGNALKFTEKGSITVVIEEISDISKNFGSEKKINSKSYSIKVIDTGIGIQKTDLEQLFHDFSTINNEQAIKLNKHGVGLGLMISQKLVQALNRYLPGAEIKVESEVGVGSTFCFPLYDQGDQSLNIIPQSCSFHSENFESERSRKDVKISQIKIPQSCIFFSDKDNFSRKQKRILIVDDDEMNLFVLFNHLSNLENFELEKASNGRVALNMIIENSKSNMFYSIIIMDNNMPVMNGIKAAREIKSLIFQGLIPDVPILASSGDDMSENSIQFGFDGFLRKPYKKKLLLETIFKLISQC
jgi:CheY-like chemotaxis protein